MVLNTESICKASSREGTRISTCIVLSSGFKDKSRGNRKASVLPDPVGESNITSFSSEAASSAASCIGFSASIFRLRSAVCINSFFCIIMAQR